MSAFPLSVFDAITGKLIAECQDYQGYLPQRKECFTLNKQERYKILSRKFYYDADMKVIAVELWVRPE